MRAGDVLKLVDVGAGEEAGRLAAGDDEEADVLLGGDAVEGGAQVGEGLAVEDVQGFPGHVEPEEGGAVLHLDPQVVCLEEGHPG